MSDKGHAVLLGHGVNMDNRTKRIPVYLPDEHRKRHTFIFGTTGVGKTRLEEILVSDDIKTGKSVILFDPKGDQRLFSVIYDQARKAKRLDDLMLITPVFPQYSVGIDPMAYYYDPEELIAHAVSGIQGDDPFYGAASRLFVTPIIWANLILAKAEKRVPTVTLHQVFQGLNKDEQAKLLSSLNSLNEDFARAEDAALYASLLQSNLAKPDDYREKILTTLQSALVPLISGNIGKIIGKADSNKLIKRLEDGKPVIAVCHTGTMISPTSAAVLGRVLLSMIQSCIGRHYLSRREKLEPTLSIHIDEAQSVITLDSLDILAKSGSANVMTHLYAQSVNQLYVALGDENAGRSALDNTNTKLFMRCADEQTSEYVSEHFGKKEVLSGIYGNNQVTTKSTEKNVLEKTDLLDLQPRECYGMTYSGRYAFITGDAPDPSCKIVFPDAPSSFSSSHATRS